MLLIDTKISFGITGNIATNLLSKVGIICNMNLIPGDLEKPSITSGIRLGTPAMTTLGYDSKDFEKIGKFIIDVLKLKNNSELNRIKQEIKQFIKNR
jgi:glycine hydroxymethyltransferase